MTQKAILKEFDLDAPTLPKEARRSFRHQSRCVTALYEQFFKPFRIQGKAWKVLIEVVPVVTKPEVRDLLGVLTLQVQGNPLQFLEASDREKPHIALAWLLSGAGGVAKTLDWPFKQFEDAAASVIEADFVNRWAWKANLWSKSKTLYCDIEVEHGFREVKIAVVFKDSNGLSIGTSNICSTSPSEFAFAPLLGKARWINERQVELVSKDGKQRWIASTTHPA